MKDSRLFRIVLVAGLGIVAGCSSNDTAPTIVPIGSAGDSTGTQAGTGGTPGSGGMTAGTGGDNNGTAGAGGSTPDTGGSGGANVGSTDGGSVQSPGCGKPWTHDTNKWVEVAGPATHVNPPPLGPLVSIPGPSDTEDRGYWVFVPKNYDPNKVGGYKVIYSGAGCDDPDRYNAGNKGYPYQTVEADAIQVGLDYDTHSFTPQCYDNRNPKSNDFAFMPWLMDKIAGDFCVDKDHQFFSGYSSGGWVAQQFNCAFPGRLRGQVSVTGSEPMDQPTCDPAPTALFHVHDLNDGGNTYGSILPGCTRVLKQNKCSVTDCSNPQSTTLTSPYTLPAGLTGPDGQPLLGADGKPKPLPVPDKTVCRQFNGCPADYPVVFCTTQLPATADRHGDQKEWAVPAFWDFMSKLK